MKAYPYVDKSRANADGSYPVYIIIRNTRGRFFINTSLTSSDKITGIAFPRQDTNYRKKSLALANYLSEIERVCLEREATCTTNAELKANILQEVFGREAKTNKHYLHSVIRDVSTSKRKSTAALYERTSRYVEQFDSKATLESVDADWLERYRQWCAE